MGVFGVPAVLFEYRIEGRPDRVISSSNCKLEVNMAKRAAKELTKVDVVARDLENLQPDEVREEFFQK